MTHDPQSLEAELGNLRAAPLDEELLLRLEACADGSMTELTREELRFEAFLRETRPSRLSPDMMAGFESIFQGVAFPVNEKIVLFPKANASVKRSSKRPVWAAAAAVALIGAASALLMPEAKPASGYVTATRPVTPPVSESMPPASGNARNFVPASFNRGVSEVHDEGVVWPSNSQPHSVVRVVYKDMITVKDKSGRTYQVEQPRVQYMLVPEKTD